MSKLKNFTLYCLIGLVFCSMIFFCTRTKEIEVRNNDNLSILLDSIQYYKNREGGYTATIGTLQLDNNQLQDLVVSRDASLAKLIKEFTTVKNLVNAKSTLKIDSIVEVFEEPIVSVPCDSIGRFERSGSIEAEWYRLEYRVNNDSLVIAPFETWTATAVITGVKSGGLFGKSKMTTDITNSNPFINVTNITAAEVVIPEPWYKKWYVWLAAGIAGGIFIK